MHLVIFVKIRDTKKNEKSSSNNRKVGSLWGILKTILVRKPMRWVCDSDLTTQAKTQEEEWLNVLPGHSQEMMEWGGGDLSLIRRVIMQGEDPRKQKNQRSRSSSSTCNMTRGAAISCPWRVGESRTA